MRRTHAVATPADLAQSGTMNGVHAEKLQRVAILFAALAIACVSFWDVVAGRSSAMSLAVLALGAFAPLVLFASRRSNVPAWRFGVTVASALAASSVAFSPLGGAFVSAAAGILLRRQWGANIRKPSLRAALRAGLLIAAAVHEPGPAVTALAAGAVVSAIFPSERVTLLLAAAASMTCGVTAAVAGDRLTALAYIIAGLLFVPLRFVGTKRSRELRHQHRRSLAGVR